MRATVNRHTLTSVASTVIVSGMPTSPTTARKIYLTLRSEFARSYPRAPRAHATAPLAILTRNCTLEGHCGARDLAYAVLGDEARVVLLKRALRLSPENIAGILAHELGHLFDPAPDAPNAERRADAVAFRALGVRVKYDSRDIQTLGAGRHPRPSYLHR